jgi:hypothetical protein
VPSEQRQAAELVPAELINETVEQLRERLQQMGAAPPAHAVVAKLLRSPPGADPQLVHSDIPGAHTAGDDTPKAAQCVSCLVNLAPRPTCSTWLPRLPAEQLLRRAAESDEQHLERLCDPIHYASYALQPGDLVAFRGDLPHYGPGNLSGEERWMLFVLFSPVEGADQDEQQQFVHC